MQLVFDIMSGEGFEQDCDVIINADMTSWKDDVAKAYEELDKRAQRLAYKWYVDDQYDNTTHVYVKSVDGLNDLLGGELFLEIQNFVDSL